MPARPETRSCEMPVDCVVSWEPWSACDDGTQSHTYSITTQPAHGGKSCPARLKQGHAKCNGCVVSWGPWSACDDECSITHVFNHDTISAWW